MTAKTDIPFCCFISDDGTECDLDAEYRIEGEPAHIDDNTDSCAKHLEPMLGTAQFRPEETKSWLVRRHG